METKKHQEYHLDENEEYIELIKLLKLAGLAQTGGHGKILIEEEQIKVNGEIETRKRKKLRKSDIVQFEDTEIKIL